MTPVRLRAREVGESRVRIVNLADNKFFGFEPVDVLGYKVMISDREKTAIDCIDRPALAGGVGEAATILATASRRFDWTKAADISNGSVQALSRGALAGSSITSRPMFRLPCATALIRLAARSREDMARTRSRARTRGAGCYRL